VRVHLDRNGSDVGHCLTLPGQSGTTPPPVRSRRAGGAILLSPAAGLTMGTRVVGGFASRAPGTVSFFMMVHISL
jgi:hypothetical protein